ncbi:MAG: arginine--tRNA ligase [Candidatus Pacebacteria bacterium]|nr:arginine--tRNA ligase [Candidatus Paceibacterota bacterium]
MDIRQEIKEKIKEALNKCDISDVEIELERPQDMSHGDYSTNVALVAGGNPKELALKIVENIDIEGVSIAGPGFINFKLPKDYFIDYLRGIDDSFGNNSINKGKRILIEYTDPNPFKQFHIGHLMSNAIGESVSRILEASGAEVKRGNYFGDVGPHVARTIWGMMNSSDMPDEGSSLERKTEFLGNSYVYGSEMYEKDPEIKTQIEEINIHIYKKDSEEINSLYEKGRRWSLEHFEEIYKKLGTSFDYYFPESEVFEKGSLIVKENLGKVFEESEGAIVFRGEDYGLHTRVFITSKGTPTYDAKEIGLQHKKIETYPYDESITITANEQADFMKVAWKAYEELGGDKSRLKHISHGMMRLSSGKMSSRKGNIITGEDLLEEVEKLARGKADDVSLSEKVAVGAIKYSILKQSPSKDIVFDFDKSLSFEGDSGPYLQYTLARINSVIEKAETTSEMKDYSENAEVLVKLITRFPEVIERSVSEYSPHYIATYLIELSSSFNAFYAKEKISDDSNNLAITKVVRIILSKGLHLLAIPTPEKM